MKKTKIADKQAALGEVPTPSKKDCLSTEDTKAYYHLLPWESVKAVSQIFREGELKYPDGPINGQTIRHGIETYMITEEWLINRYNHAMERLRKFIEGDTSENHLAKVAWFCLVQMEVDRLVKDEGYIIGEGWEE